MNTDARRPVARLVLLGASNLQKSLPTLVRIAAAQLGSPLEIYVAHGHGRSYGRMSRVAGRVLPGITECGLWNALPQRSSLPTFALLTDIGNDLLNGVGPETVLDWVATCIERCAALDARIVVTKLPVPQVSELSGLRYGIFRTIFFPRCRLSCETVCALAATTNEGLVELAERYSIDVVSTQKHWYGIDPIHIRRGARLHAWQWLLQGWCTRADDSREFIYPLKSRVLTQLAAPQERQLFGRKQVRQQPAVVLQDGTTISIY